MSVFAYKETIVEYTQLILRKHNYKQADRISKKLIKIQTKI